MLRVTRLLAVSLFALAAGACGSDDPAISRGADSPSGAEAAGQLVVYSGRNENLVRPLIDRFAEESGIDVEVRYADTTELTATLLEEGDASPADVFFSQDAGALAALAQEGLLSSLDEATLEGLDERFRDPEGRYAGITGRARTLAYDPDTTQEGEVPNSFFDVTDPKWKGRVGVAPTNASFVSHISALRVEFGDDKVKQFLSDLEANEPKIFDSNLLVVQAVDSGEVDLGLVNHYYALNEKQERPDSSVVNAFPEEGAFVNLAGVGVLESADNRDEAQRFVEFLLSEEGQEYFRTETNEFPLVEGVEGPQGLPAVSELDTIKAPLGELGEFLESTSQLIQEAGLT
jgi:iron(III) transport system substrate-binding protein